MESRNNTPHGYEWRYHLKPGQPGARWVLCRKRSAARLARIQKQAEQRVGKQLEQRETAERTHKSS
jgi:hypothetical protein